jgi:hypothetical protein
MPSHDSVLRDEAGHGEQTDTGALPGPLRHFVNQLDGLSSAGVPDMDAVGRLLVQLAADEEFFGPLIQQLPAGAPGDRWLVRPVRGPRLVLVHRPDAVMGYTHIPTGAGSPSPRSAAWRPISGGTRSATQMVAPTCAWPNNAPWFPVRLRR